jgi:hypothetical protein
MNWTFSNLRSTTGCLVLALVGQVAGGCDVPAVDLGDETDGSAGTVTKGDGKDECEPGDEKLAPDGCNTCFCDQGTWACTEIACGDTSGGADPTGGSDGDGSDGGGVLPPCEGDPECAPIACPLTCANGLATGTDGCEVCECADAPPTCTPVQCTPGAQVPAPDGCNTCTCSDEGQWGCTKIACEPGDDPFGDNGATICSEDTPNDALVVTDAAVLGNELLVTVAYSGGCAEHLLGMCWTGSFLESFPVQAQAHIAHDSMGDTCKALPSEDRVFDLTPMAEAYQEGYQTDTGTIIIQLDGWPQSLEYSF